jgi:hypothetical protein
MHSNQRKQTQGPAEKRGCHTFGADSTRVELTLSTQNIPEDVQRLVAEHQQLFQPPTSLPPSRAYDHKIPVRLALFGGEFELF